MDVSKITSGWLRSQNYKIKFTYRCPTIRGVVLKELETHLDGRGSVTEVWSKPWVKKEKFSIPKHIYQSVTDFGVVKCWHLHKKQTDQLVIARGKIQIVLVDLRHNSPTLGQVNPIFAGIEKPRLLKIPPGILHGWKALSSPEVVVFNFATKVYDPKDEYRFPWDCILKDIWEPING
jgi:dTDP-4-dehydrorhamnose 3,5-epimerase